MTGKTFLCLQASAPSLSKGSPPSPAAMEAIYTQFNAWREKYTDNLINLGGRLAGPAKTVSGDGMIEGPLVEVRELIGGYMIVAAGSMEEAARIVQEMPGLGENSSLTLREIAQS